jgi:hypothetical protein
MMGARPEQPETPAPAVAPMVPDRADWYEEHGLSMFALGHGPTAGSRIRQGRDWRELPSRRRR